MKRRLPPKALLLRVAGLILFAVVLTRQDFGAVARAFKSVNIRLYAAVLLLFLPAAFLKAVRWRALLQTASGVRLPLRRAFFNYLSSMFLGACTPGRLGELYRVSLATRAGASPGPSVISVLFDRAYDLTFLLLAGTIAVLCHYGVLERDLWRVTLVLMAGVLGMALLYRLRSRILSLIRTLARALLSRTQADGLDQEFDRMGASARRCLRSRWQVPSLLTLCAWSLYFLQRYLMAVSAGIAVNFLFLSLAMTAVALLAVLPISILNIGTRDAVLILFLAPLGITTEQALVLSSLILLGMLLNTLVCGVVFLLGRNP